MPVLKMLQHVLIIIQIIFRELVGFLLKSPNLKVFISFLKLWRLFVVIRQHNIWCGCVRGILCGEVFVYSSLVWTRH